MPKRFRVPRSITGAALVVAGLVAVVGGLSLRGPGLVAVGVAGALAACLGWGMAREAPEPTRRSPLEAAVLAMAWTVGTLLVLAGTSVLAGGLAAALLAGFGGAVALALWMVRAAREDAQVRAAHRLRPVGDAPLSSLHRLESPRRPLPPVTGLSTQALGQEWLESTAALAGPLRPTERSTLVARRQQAMDELERRDPDGFLRWISAGPTADPADYVRGRDGESAGDPQAGAA